MVKGAGENHWVLLFSAFPFGICDGAEGFELWAVSGVRDFEGVFRRVLGGEFGGELIEPLDGPIFKGGEFGFSPCVVPLVELFFCGVDDEGLGDELPGGGLMIHEVPDDGEFELGDVFV